MKELLESKYRELQSLCDHVFSDHCMGINFIIKNTISEFLKECKKPAIWCYGKHTRMLMADFMFELKGIHYIIDNSVGGRDESGFELISENQIIEKEIDGVIISTRKYKDDIISRLKKSYKNVRFLDIYEEIQKCGITLDTEYYVKNHPYNKYRELNYLQREKLYKNNGEYNKETLKKIIFLYIEIKDFCTAIEYAEKMVRLTDGEWEQKLLKCLNELYQLQKKGIEKVDSSNVVMLCIDGLRRQDVNENSMENLYGFLKNRTCYFSNAYSVSTSTYESLIPVYSENTDLRTKYYENNSIKETDCRFLNEAKRQNRKIYFYTDGTAYIEDQDIKVTPGFQTATEKIWDFLLDSVDEKQGLFYIHLLYESHYSYPNPYTLGEIVADGTNILFDYLSHNGGEIRTDYEKQQKDSLRYLDYVIVPLIERLPCRMILYADHGNILIKRGVDIRSIEKTKYTFHEDLIQVPFAIKSPEIEVGVNVSLISIMELNQILIDLMNKRKIDFEKGEFVKVVRSSIYNPDFKYLYAKAGYERGLLAFEVFIFKEGYKLAVYEDGVVELYLTETDSFINNIDTMNRLLHKVIDRITVCDLSVNQI